MRNFDVAVQWSARTRQADRAVRLQQVSETATLWHPKPLYDYARML